MSLSSAVNTALSAVKASAKSASIHVANIAKSGEVAGKGTETFILGNSNGMSTSSNYVPGSVSAKTQRHIDVVGDSKVAEVNTFMSIGGRGMFVVSSSSTPETGKIGFTRVGTFQPDKYGHFKNTSEQYLMVHPTDTLGRVTSTDTTTTDGLVVASISDLRGEPVPTSTIGMKMVLPASKDVNFTCRVQTKVVDSLGVSHDVTFNWQKTQANPQQWTVTAACPDAAAIGGPYNAGMVVQFDAQGKPATINGANVVPPANNAPNLQITWNSPAAQSNMTVFMGTIGNSDGIQAFGDMVNSNEVTADGQTAGRLEGTYIEDETGLIYAQYDNGARVPFAKIPLAMFNQVNGLLETTGGVYTETSESGSYQLTTSGQNGSGKIVSSSIEESKIDSTEELVGLVENQTRYQTNGKALSVMNEMQQAALNMV